MGDNDLAGTGGWDSGSRSCDPEARSYPGSDSSISLDGHSVLYATPTSSTKNTTSAPDALQPAQPQELRVHSLSSPALDLATLLSGVPSSPRPSGSPMERFIDEPEQRIKTLDGPCKGLCWTKGARPLTPDNGDHNTTCNTHQPPLSTSQSRVVDAEGGADEKLPTAGTPPARTAGYDTDVCMISSSRDVEHSTKSIPEQRSKADEHLAMHYKTKKKYVQGECDDSENECRLRPARRHKAARASRKKLTRKRGSSSK